MYQWYTDSRVCYTYLYDVHGSSIPTELDDEKYPQVERLARVVFAWVDATGLLVMGRGYPRPPPTFWTTFAMHIEADPKQTYPPTVLASPTLSTALCAPVSTICHQLARSLH